VNARPGDAQLKTTVVIVDFRDWRHP
jgi:hypothetical protein